MTEVPSTHTSADSPGDEQDFVTIRHNGQLYRVPASKVFPKQVVRPPGTVSSVHQPPEAPGLTYEELQRTRAYKRLPTLPKSAAVATPKLVTRPKEPDAASIDRGKQVLNEMRSVVASCLQPASGMKTAEFQASFGPHIFHAALCIKHAVEELNSYDLDREQYDVVHRIITYAVHVLVEYITLASLPQKVDEVSQSTASESDVVTPDASTTSLEQKVDPVSLPTVNWSKIPVYVRHRDHEDFVATLVAEAISLTKNIVNTHNPSVQSSIACQLLLGSHQSYFATMTIGMHLRSFFDADEHNDEGDLSELSDSDCSDFEPTNAPPGTPEKIEILRHRIELGLPLYHELDRTDYSGLIGAIRPRE